MVVKYTSKREIHERAKDIENRPFKELSNPKEINKKNSIGDIFERWFGKEKDSASKPDLGLVELKTTPYRKLKRGNKYSSKERLVLNLINYNELVKEDFEDSHFLKKNKSIEIGFYEYKEEVPKLEWFIDKVVLFEMSKNPVDYKIIQDDWYKIRQYVLDGKAEELSESLTTYLAACTKGENNKDKSKQPYSDVLAKRRAFSLKQGYMTQLLRNNILGNKKNDSIIKNVDELKDTSLKDVISDRLEKYIGRTTVDLKKEFKIKYKGNSLNNILIKNMLGIHRGNSTDLINIEELKKAMYLAKTIQFDKRGYNRQSMSFPYFDFKNICEEEWEDQSGTPSAELNMMLSESTMIFCVFQYDSNGNNFFKGPRFKIEVQHLLY